jgi:hypothetical protein
MLVALMWQGSERKAGSCFAPRRRLSSTETFT